MTKKSPDILDFFKPQIDKNMYCPACGISVSKVKLNEHLDTLCISLAKNCSRNDVEKSLSKSESDDDFKKVSIRKNCKKSKLSRSAKNKRSSGDVSVAQQLANKTKNFDKQDSLVEFDEVVFLEEVPSCLTGTEIISNNTCTFDAHKTRAKGSRQTPKEQKPSSHKRSKTNLKEVLKNDNVFSLAQNKPVLKKVTSNISSEICIDAVFNNSVAGENLPTLSKHEVNQSYSPNEVFHSDTNPTSRTVKRKYSHIESVSLDSGCDSLIISGSKILKPDPDSISEALLDAVLNDGKQDEDEFLENSLDTKSDVLNENKTYSPYYLANFKYILKTVLSEETNLNLLNEEDNSFINAFESVSNAAQKLYVRLFQRKYKWLRPNKLNYPEIAQDLSPALEELVNVKILESGLNQIDLQSALNILTLPEAKLVAKSFNFSSGKNKTEIAQLLLKLCKEHRSVFFSNGTNSVHAAILKKVKHVLGACYRISLLPKRLFTRILMLFSLPTISEDDEEAAGGQQQQLLTLLQVNKGELIFPEYERKREAVIFQDRDELIRYEEAKQLESDILSAVESKTFETAKDLYLKADERLEEQKKSDYSNRAASLPVFLKRYTSFHVYIKCLYQGVEALQKLRQYEDAVSLLRKLLDQKVFCQDYRGKWYDRLALNLEQHLKQPKPALSIIKEALGDHNVRVGPRYSLLMRAQRIVRAADENDLFKKEILNGLNVLEAPKVTIKGRLVPRTILGRRHVFASNAMPNEDVTVLGVEQLALEHYRDEGFPDGIHGEGSTFISLYTLLFWDIIYDGSIPDVFISPYQHHPLDLNSETFFLSRESQIMSHLETLRNSTVEKLKETVKATWETHHGKASLVNWELFVDVEHAQCLVGCFGSAILCGICERLSKDFRFTRSGVPDLCVWNGDTGRVKVIEVKGPGDKLSSKQILWLDYLMKLGADAEVCLVEAVLSKKLRKE